jgi:hypothetical protein
VGAEQVAQEEAGPKRKTKAKDMAENMAKDKEQTST